MKSTHFLNVIFLIILFLQISTGASMKTHLRSKVKKDRRDKTIKISGYYKTTDDKKNIIASAALISKENKDKVYFLFFTEFYSSLKPFYDSIDDLLMFKPYFEFQLYYSKNKTENKPEISEIIVIKDGVISENKKINKFNEELITFLFDKYDLNKDIQRIIEKANSTASEFSKNVTEVEIDENILLQKAQKAKSRRAQHSEGNKSNRLTRFVWAFLLMIIVSIAIFFLVKYSIDWATSSRNELNKLKDQKLKEVTDFLLTKEKLNEDY